MHYITYIVLHYKVFYILYYFFFAGAAPDDTLGDFFDARARRSAEQGGFFSRFIRRTLPFQLIPQPPLAYARASNYVGEPVPVEVDTQEEITDERDYKPKSSPKDILNMLENLTKQMDGKARMRYGFF